MNIKEIIWQPPLELWVKCNINGASNNITISCGDIFRKHNAKLLCGFVENTSLKSAFMAELSSAMRVIEILARLN
jgi:hypothetical protein